MIKGRDLITGLPREVVITESDIREAIGQSIATLLDAAKEVLETTPPEVVSDVMQRGVYVTGGGALIAGIDQVLHEHLGLPVHISEDPLTAVARGTGIILEDIEKYSDILLVNEDDTPPQI